MIRLVKMSETWYSFELKDELSFQEDIENIMQFVSEGSPVVIVEDLEAVAEFLDCEIEDIEKIE